MGEISVREDEKPIDVALKTYDKLNKDDIIVKIDRPISSNEIYQDFIIDDYYVQIEIDQFVVSFEELFNDLVKMALFHKRYNLPNNVDFSTDDFAGWTEMENHIEKTAVVIEPISMTDHSGLYIYGGRASGWDSGIIGYMYITKEDMEKEGLTEDKCEQILKHRIDALADYASGNVFDLSVYDISNEPGKEFEKIDSCNGFLGTDFKNNGILETVEEFVGKNLDYSKKINV